MKLFLIERMKAIEVASRRNNPLFEMRKKEDLKGEQHHVDLWVCFLGDG